MATQALSDGAISARTGAIPPAQSHEQAKVLVRKSADWTEPAFVSQWDELAASASEPNPFYESWYLGPALKHVSGNHHVILLSIERDDRLIGLLPLIKQRSYYGHPLPHWRNWVHANCFCGMPLIASGAEREVWNGILDWCDAQGGLGLFLHLTHIPTESAPAQALAKLCTKNRPAFIVQSEERALLQSEKDAETYLHHAVPTKKRKELRRQQRRLSELGELRFDRETDAEGLSQWISDFLELEAAGWKGEAQSALATNPGTTQLFEQALTGAARQNKLERIALSLDGKPIAMLANFISAPAAFSYKTAFDERYARFSPGVLLQLENLALLERNDVAWSDSCADADHPMIDKIWRERRTLARINVAIGGATKRALFRQIARQEGGVPFCAS